MASSEEKNKQEEEIKSFCQNRALKKLAAMAAFLESVSLDDNYRDKRAVKVKIWDTPDKKEFHYEIEDQDVPVSVNIRVTAAKTWKELIADKAIGDVKEKAKETKRDALDMKKAMEAIAKVKQAQKNALKEESL